MMNKAFRDALGEKPWRVQRWLYARGYRPDPKKGTVQAILYSPSLAMVYAWREANPNLGRTWGWRD